MQQPPPPEPDAQITSLIDTTPITEEIRIRFRLGELKRLAESANDAPLANVVRCEGNVFLIFDERRTYDSLALSVPLLLFASDVAYLRARAAQTQNHRAKARYLHAVAAVTQRYDDGRAAAEGYLAAIRAYRNQERRDNFDAFHALRHLFPLAMQAARRYGVFDALKVEAMEFLLDGDEIYGVVKAELLKSVVEDTRGFNVDDMRRLRDFSLELPWMLRGNMQPEITAVAKTGMRLADRLQESRREWYEAEVRALQGRLDLGVEPIAVEMIGTRLLRLAQLLADDVLHKRTIERMRAARAKVKYFEFSGQPDDWPEQVQKMREAARKITADNGPAALLRWLATAPKMIPSVAAVRGEAGRQEAAGVGIFRKIATRTSSIGERVIGQSCAPEDAVAERLDEIYDIAWQFDSVLRLSVFMAELVPSGEIRLEDLERHLQQSWIGREEDVSYGGGAKMPNDLVRLLVAGLQLYVQLHTEQTNEDSIIPALDTLTLRTEAVIRKFARLLGVPDSRTVDDGHSNPVTKVAGIELLDHRRIVEKCGEDLIAFAKHTLDRSPEGLRDRIGHAILHTGQYRSLDLDAVVLLLLRLSGIELEVNEAGEDGAA